MTVTTQVDGAETSSGQLPRRLGLLTGLLLVVANMIGTGVFTTTGFMVSDLQSPPAILLAWLVSGLAALCGALCYAELGAALPQNGGEFQLLSRIYHPAVGFASGWTSLIVGFSAPVAASAIAFGNYLQALSPGVSPTLAAILLILALATMHSVNVRAGSAAQNVLTFGKIALILAFIGGGFWLGDWSLLSQPGPSWQSAVFSKPFAVDLVFISFSYAGWNSALYLAGELKRPERNIPISLILGTLIVTVLYVGLNAMFLAAAPMSQLAGKVEVGHTAAVSLYGESAGRAMSLMITIGLVSAVSGLLMAGPRVYEAMGRTYPRLSFLSVRHSTGGPVVATWLQAGLACGLIATASFDVLMIYIGFTLSLFTLLAVVGVFVLRFREPALDRPYRTLGYPVTPLLFILLEGWMTVHVVLHKPLIVWFGVATISGGVILYLLVRQRPVAGRPH